MNQRSPVNSGTPLSACDSTMTTAPSTCWRVVPTPTAPFAQTRSHHAWEGSGPWPAKWIRPGPASSQPSVVAYRLCTTVSAETSLQIVVSADERYELYVDGQRVGRGPERGDALHWAYEVYQLQLSAGEHVIV